MLCIAFFVLFSIGFLEFHRLGFCCNFQRTLSASLEFLLRQVCTIRLGCLAEFWSSIALIDLAIISFIRFGGIVEVYA